MIAIVTDVHYRMSLALIRDLSQAGVEVITCEWEGHRENPASPALGAMSRHTSRHVWLPEDQGAEPIRELCREVMEERGARPALLPAGAATLAAVAAGSWEVFICTRISPMPSASSLSSPKNSKKPTTHTMINRNLYLGFIRLNCAKVIQTTAYPVLPGRSYPSPPL